jgi:RND family efflux transporter MFP subunit
MKQAEANERHAKARLQLAQADLKRLEVLIEYAQVKAPFAGVIVDRQADPGTFVATAASNRAEPPFTLCRMDRLRVVVDIPESQAALIRTGQPVELEVDALPDQRFTGTIRRTAGILDNRTRTLRAEAELDSISQLRPGMFGQITIDFSCDRVP